VNYRVQPGDTLYGIAVRFGVPVEQIIRANNLVPPYQLYVGQNLFIPGGAQPRPPRPTPGNVERRLDALEDRADRTERRLDRLEQRVSRLERRS